jgi:hypothetical protein
MRKILDESMEHDVIDKADFFNFLDSYFIEDKCDDRSMVSSLDSSGSIVLPTFNLEELLSQNQDNE